MDQGRLSGSYFGGKRVARTYRYEAHYRREGDRLRYLSTIWCEGDVRAQSQGVADERPSGEAGDEAAIRSQIQASIDRLVDGDARLLSARRYRAAIL